MPWYSFRVSGYTQICIVYVDAWLNMSTNKKSWKYNPIARDLAKTKYRQRIKRDKSPYDDDDYDIDLELLEMNDTEKESDP